MMPTKPICLPPAPLNGGALDTAPPKVGEWIWQPKIDDWRGIVHTPTLTVWNQYGQLSSVAERGQIGLALAHLCGPSAPKSSPIWPEWLDIGIMQNRNDMMRGCIVVFDLVQATDYYCRREQLEALFPVLPPAPTLLQDGVSLMQSGIVRDKVFLISEHTHGNKLYNDLREYNRIVGRKFYEGVVAKRVKAAYPFFQTPKSPWPDFIKHRFDQ
jgi:hypothetical protein